MSSDGGAWVNAPKEEGGSILIILTAVDDGGKILGHGYHDIFPGQEFGGIPYDELLQYANERIPDEAYKFEK